MELIRGVQTLKRTLTRPVLTIGNFDGVHLGHRKIIQLTLDQARARQGTAVAFTFRPHPQIALRPEAGTRLLMTYDEKLEALGALGLDVIVEEPFSREFSSVAPEQFFTDTLLRRLNAEAIVVGYDFAFGKGREGHLEVLGTLCKQAGVELSIVQPHRVEGEIASSSKIRQHLLAGEIEAANHLLGREFFYRGVIVRGDGRGRHIGFPTANMSLAGIYSAGKLVLPLGVYATWVLVGGERLPGVTNIGVRPTFRDPANAPAGESEGTPSDVLVETHVLNRSFDLYGETLEVRVVKRLRSEKKFPGIAELKTQISRDVEQARLALGLSEV